MKFTSKPQAREAKEESPKATDPHEEDHNLVQVVWVLSPPNGTFSRAKGNHSSACPSHLDLRALLLLSAASDERNEAVMVGSQSSEARVLKPGP